MGAFGENGRPNIQPLNEDDYNAILKARYTSCIEGSNMHVVHKELNDKLGIVIFYHKDLGIGYDDWTLENYHEMVSETEEIEELQIEKANAIKKTIELGHSLDSFGRPKYYRYYFNE